MRHAKLTSALMCGSIFSCTIPPMGKGKDFTIKPTPNPKDFTKNKFPKPQDFTIFFILPLGTPVGGMVIQKIEPHIREGGGEEKGGKYSYLEENTSSFMPPNIFQHHLST